MEKGFHDHFYVVLHMCFSRSCRFTNAANSLSTLLTTQIISNTTIARPPPVDAHPLAQETGGLSGKPLFDSSTRVLRDMYILTSVRALSRFLPKCGIYLF